MIAIFGAGGHTYSLLNILELNDFKIIGIYDETFVQGKNESISDYKILGGMHDIPSDCEVVISKGDNLLRAKLFENFKSQVCKRNLIHPNAEIEKNVTLKGSNQIFSGVYINSQASIGEDNIINTKSIIEHEATIGNHNHIAVGATLCGRVKVGNFCFVGAGAVIVDKVSICDNVIIGANAVVTKDIVEPGTYVGVPGKKIK